MVGDERGVREERQEHYWNLESRFPCYVTHRGSGRHSWLMSSDSPSLLTQTLTKMRCEYG